MGPRSLCRASLPPAAMLSCCRRCHIPMPPQSDQRCRIRAAAVGEDPNPRHCRPRIGEDPDLPSSLCLHARTASPRLLRRRRGVGSASLLSKRSRIHAVAVLMSSSSRRRPGSTDIFVGERPHRRRCFMGERGVASSVLLPPL